MNFAYVILGANLGDKLRNLANAKIAIQKSVGNILKESNIYETAPWGKPDQPSFLNQVLMLQTNLTAIVLLDSLLSIEIQMGRTRDQKYDARIIDIDILFYNREVIQQERLTIPHPQIQYRKFVLVPLVQIVPNKIHPVLHKSLKQLLNECTDVLEVYDFKA